MMQKFKNTLASWTTSALLAGLVLTLSACSSENPMVSPADEQLTLGKVVQTTAGPMRILQEQSYNATSLSKKGSGKGGGWKNRLYSTEKFIHAEEGGALIVGHPTKTGKSKIFFEPNDLPEDMTIRFEWRASSTLEGTLNSAEFGPHGLQFNKPVRVELSYKLADLTGVEEESLQVIYFNEKTQLWELVGGTVDTQKQVVVAYLDHFSRYAIGGDF
jgi:hypothetical protein